MIYSNTELKQNLQARLNDITAGLSPAPVLNIAMVGQDFASRKYIGIKQKIGAKLGIGVQLHEFGEDIDLSEFQDRISYLLPSGDGLICQLPLPQRLMPALDLIPAEKDVDFLGVQTERLWRMNMLPPTIGAIDLVFKDILLPQTGANAFLDSFDGLDLSGKTAAVVGQGKLVGGPLLRYLSQRGATVFSLNKDTADPKRLTSSADILISAAGQPGLIQPDWIKPGAIVVDAATSESDGGQVGDVGLELELPEDTVLVPSPGGIGPLTVLCLFQNLLGFVSRN